MVKSTSYTYNQGTLAGSRYDTPGAPAQEPQGQGYTQVYPAPDAYPPQPSPPPPHMDFSASHPGVVFRHRGQGQGQQADDDSDVKLFRRISYLKATARDRGHLSLRLDAPVPEAETRKESPNGNDETDDDTNTEVSEVFEPP